eukprot:TRINITY_DN2589_c0_g5_i5.p1 TRINITY_DN2589_c0_g5~~TRINITY_DN2589_c0_g5_i5.p1  ORF type:complete len:107 (+),score=7.78 TRINITY_DN2589_c0_g5_i5:443-763(+)
MVVSIDMTTGDVLSTRQSEPNIQYLLPNHDRQFGPYFCKNSHLQHLLLYYPPSNSMPLQSLFPTLSFQTLCSTKVRNKVKEYFILLKANSKIIFFDVEALTTTAQL